MNDTKTKILDVAEDLIQRVGLNAMSYQHISKAVGIRKASIHHHFPKKENLIEELLERCQVSYGERYSTIVNGHGTAPDKLKKIAEVFKNGLANQKLCVVGSISTDKNTLQENSCSILEKNISKTITIFASVFQQGEDEYSLKFAGNAEDVAYTFFSFLVGAQIVARSNGGINTFQQSAELFIQNVTK